MESLRILLADDHTLLRAGLRALLEDLPGVEVVAEAADGLEALALAASLRPDVVLMDIDMPGLSGLDAAERLRGEQPGVRVLILSMHKDEAYVRRAALAGAGYLLKDADAEELAMALRATASGETYLCPAAATQLLADYRRRAGRPGPLTPRQEEVLRAIAQGATTKAIARALGISVKTVETHRAQLMERLGVHDVPGLVRYAIRRGLVAPEP